VPPPPTLEQADGVLESLRQILWAVNEAPPSRDSRGRTVAQDLNEFVLAAAPAERIEELRAQAADAPDEASRSRALADLGPLLLDETYRAAMIGSYRRLLDVFEHHRNLLLPLMAQVGGEETLQARLAAIPLDLAANFEKAIRIGDFEERNVQWESLRSRARELSDGYNSERKRLVGRLPPELERGTVAPLERAMDCGAPVPGDPERPSIGLHEPSSPAEFYPAHQEFMEVTGVTLVEISVSATGCAEQVAVVGTSGVADLDQAALSYALAQRYRPGWADGAAVARRATLPLRFTLHD
jgi:TonB family protein